MLLNFKREFSLEDSLRCFEILSSHHLEVSSTEACKAQDIERQRHFEQEGNIPHDDISLLALMITNA